MRYPCSLLAVLAALPVACSAGGKSQKSEPGSSHGGSLNLGSGASGASAGSGGALNLGAGATMSGGAASNLPEPWQYYAEDGSFGFKDSSLPDGVRMRFPEMGQVGEELSGLKLETPRERPRLDRGLL